MEVLFLKLVNLSITASWLVLAIMILRIVFRKVPKEMMAAMWAIVGIRLLCPFSLESAFSVVRNQEVIPMNIGTAPITIVEQGTTAVSLPETSVQNIVFFLSVIWILGIAVMGIYALVSYWKIRKNVEEAINVKENVWVSDRVNTPFILGIIKPQIYLPYEMEEADVKYVIAHEKAHMKRRDHLWKPLGFMILAVYWFNPVLWIAYITLCKDIELACDEKVIREMGLEMKKPYSDALINCSMPRKMIAACPLAFGEVGIKKRISSILNYKKPVFWMLIVTILVCIGLAAGFLTKPRNLDERLQVFIDCAIAGHHQSAAGTDNFSCLDWEVLGVEKKSLETTVYMWVLYEEYSYDQELKEEAGAHVPTAITVKKVDGEYTLKEYWEPGDGSKYEKDIREKFPWYLQRKALNPLRYIEEQKESCEKMAEEYFKEEKARQEEHASGLEKIYPQYFGLDAEKGLQVYIWQMAADNYSCALVAGKEIEWPYGELLKLKTATMNEMRAILSTYNVSSENVNVHVIDMPISSYYHETDDEYKKQIVNKFWGISDQIPAEEDDWGVSMGLTFINSTKFEVTFNHTSDWMKEEGELTTTAVYGINAIHNGETMSFGAYMRDVLLYDYLEPDVAWDDVLYTILPDGTLTMSGDLSVIYGDIPPGTYELWKRVKLTKENGEEMYRVYSAEFAVVD